MATEEASIVAASIKACYLSLPRGFSAIEPTPLMTFQVQVTNWKNKKSVQHLLKRKQDIFTICNSVSKTITELGGGAKKLSVKKVKTSQGTHLVLYVLVD